MLTRHASCCAAIPVTVFITTCFGIASDNEAPESWLQWTGWRKLVWGINGALTQHAWYSNATCRLTRATLPAPAAHRRWHFTRGEPPARYVLWYVRSKDAPLTETAGNLFRSFWAFITGTETAWVLEAREAAAAADATESEKGETCGAKEHQEEGSHESCSATSSARGAKELSAEKRQVMMLGLLATATCWALFVWFIFTCACLQPARAVRRFLTPSCASQTACSSTG